MLDKIKYKETYYGYKVYALITFEGYLASFEITLASTDGRGGLHGLANHWSNVIILADKDYVEKTGKEYLYQIFIVFMESIEFIISFIFFNQLCRVNLCGE